MDESSLGVVIRPYSKVTDEACIYATWRNGAYYGAIRKFKGSSDRFFREQTELIKETIHNANCLIRCAVLEDEPQVILGFSVVTGSHLDWIFVKADFRRQGIASLLFPKNIKTVTDQLTKVGQTIAKKKNLTIGEPREAVKGESNGAENKTKAHQL